MRVFLGTILATGFLLSHCSSPTSKSTSDATNATDETDGVEKTETAGSCGTGEVPAPTQGQIAVKIDASIDPCSVSGFVVGSESELKMQMAADGTFYVNNVPEGEQDVIITGQLAVSTALTAGEVTHGIRLNDIAVSAGATKDLATIGLPALGAVNGTAKLAQPVDISDHAGIDVYIPGTSYIAKTAMDGSYSLAGLPVGTHNLFFEKDGYHRGVIQKVDVKSAETTAVEAVDLLLKTDGLGGLVLANGVNVVNTQNVKVGILPTQGAVLMKISEDDNFANAAFQPIVSSTTYEFDGVGDKRLYIVFADANGQSSSTFHDDIHIDKAGPTGSITLQSGATFATSASVNVTATLEDMVEIKELMISQSETFEGASWQPYAANTGFNLTGGDGLKTVYLKAKDAFGNESAPLSDSITLDTTNPTLDADTLVPANNATNVTPVNTSIAATFHEAVSGVSAATVKLATTIGNVDCPLSVVFTSPDISANESCDGLEPGTAHTVTVGTAIHDQAGNPMTSAYTWSFTTGGSFTRANSTKYPFEDAGAAIKSVVSDVDNQGNAFVVYAAGGKVYAKRYRAGYGWQTALEVATSLHADSKIGFEMNDAGDAAVAWFDESLNVKAAIFDKTAGSWGAATDVDNTDTPDAATNAIAVAVAPNGDVAVGWYSQSGPTGRDILIAVNDGSWSNPAIASDNTTNSKNGLKLAFTSTGKLIAAWEQVTSYRIAGAVRSGGTWGAEERLDRSQADLDRVNSLDLDADAAGNAIVSFIEETDPSNDNGDNVYTVVVNRYTGTSWAGAVDVASTGSESASFWTRTRAVAFGSGKAALSYLDSGVDITNLFYFDGTSWTSSKTLSESPARRTSFAVVNDSSVVATYGHTGSGMVYKTHDLTGSWNSPFSNESSYSDTADIVSSSETLALSKTGLAAAAAWVGNTNTRLYYSFYRQP